MSLKNTVLIVDDESSNIMALTFFLKSDYTVYAARNGQDAVKAAERRRPDIILLDIVMPDMDGYAVIASLKESNKTRDIPVIFISSLGDAIDEEKGLALGAMDYITKPFTPAIVKLRIQNQIKLITQTRLIMEKEMAEEKLAAESAALEHANLMQTEIMETISHETRTPLAVIMSYAEVTAKEARKSGIKKEIVANLDMIAAEARRMAEMMEDLRQIGVARSKLKEISPVDLGAVINRIAGLYKKIFEQKDINMQLNVPSGLPFVKSNKNELTQVMINLLRNCEKYAHGGTVTISAVSTDKLIEITVSDTGPGISEELLPHVFERGVHAGGGNGYGLSICRDILRIYGGDIWIENNKDGGASVIFTLPPLEGDELL
jgi:signal transduction histidine kinase